MRNLVISGKKVGNNQPIFIIVEAGVNNNGRLDLALKLIDVVAEAGADAVKFQTFEPDKLVIKSADKADYQVINERRNKEGQYAMLKRLVLKKEHHQRLKKYAEKKGLIFLSTPFSLSDAEFLRKLGVPAIKVGSSDTNNLPYLAHIAKWGLPIILSTGMSDFKEVKGAVAVLRKAGNRKLAVLQCTTNYPTPFSEANLLAMKELEKLGVIVGFSDHTPGVEASVAAVALGAKIIEKHFTLDKNLPGPDHLASLNPAELKLLITSIRNVEKALGSGKKTPFPSERKIAKVARKSLVAIQPIKKGEKFNLKNLGIKRPGTGLAPKYFYRVLGKKAKKDISADALIKKSMIYA